MKVDKLQRMGGKLRCVIKLTKIIIKHQFYLKVAFFIILANIGQKETKTVEIFLKIRFNTSILSEFWKK